MSNLQRRRALGLSCNGVTRRPGNEIPSFVFGGSFPGIDIQHLASSGLRTGESRESTNREKQMELYPCGSCGGSPRKGSPFCHLKSGARPASLAAPGPEVRSLRSRTCPRRVVDRVKDTLVIVIPRLRRRTGHAVGAVACHAELLHHDWFFSTGVPARCAFRYNSMAFSSEMGERFIDPFGIKPSPVERPEVEGR